MASIVSRAREDPPPPKYMTEAIISISIPLMESVRTRVPKGSRTRSARASAWRTTANAEMEIAPKSHPSINPNQAGFERSPSHCFPKQRKKAVVAIPNGNGHSRLTIDLMLVAIAIATQAIVIRSKHITIALIDEALQRNRAEHKRFSTNLGFV